MSVNTKVSGRLVRSAGLYKVSVPIQSGDIYSFEERQIGVWADSKPLYQKTYEFTNVIQVNANSYTTLITNCGLNIDAIVYGESSPSKSETFTPISVKHDNDNISCYYNTSWSVKYLTIRYTKTTDVAGSGEYVPSGDKAVHYDDTEQVIGTWFGETLYRKTVNFGALPNTTVKNVAHGISNIGYIKSYEGTAYNPTNGYYISLPYLHSSVSNNDVEIYFNDTNVSIVTKADRSVYTTCYITLEYTKASS